MNATRISNGSRWIVSGPVRGQTVVVGFRTTARREKATEGAEKSFHPRRRKRGLRKGKRRSRAGKACRSAPARPLIPNTSGVSRKNRRYLREVSWFETRSSFIYQKVVEPLVRDYPDTFGDRAYLFIPALRRKWDGLLSLKRKLVGNPFLREREVITWKVVVAQARSSYRSETAEFSGASECGFGDPTSLFGSELAALVDGIDDGRRRIRPPVDYDSGCVHNGSHRYCDLCGACLKRENACPGPHVKVLPGKRRWRFGRRH